ncbi:MAG: metallophosphoesterase family protein [Dehalococcoidales bacterium]|nr:metallophosphoesterase family protein [Dehalococcoidales bacterium]
MLVAVISDIHSNLAALQAVLADMSSVDEVWCLGDTVGYGPDPNECLALLLQQKHLAIAGNHDWASVGKLDLSSFNPDAQTANLWTSAQLTDTNKEIIRNLPRELTVGEFTLAHGSPREPIWEYILDSGQAAANLRYFDTKYCLVGHTHVPAVFLSPAGREPAGSQHPSSDTVVRLGERRLIVNPGSVGQPRDGDPRAAYAILDTAGGTLRFRRVEYDIAATQEKMRRAGLPYVLWARLSAGW